jgi:hypothetical protein
VIRIGERIQIRPGDRNENTVILFDEEPVGLIARLRMEFDARFVLPVMEVDICRLTGSNVEPNADFINELMAHDFVVSLIDYSDGGLRKVER